ncbi:MAG: PAS domain S-box protein [Candidatus Caenarcaniphilales bacterium]|nr:PAS domain S-box protein [Candidatus Caenarcaniphilales bacterium]
MLEENTVSNKSLDASNLMQLFNLSTDLMCTASTEGYFLELNTAWEQALGYTRDELKAKPFVNFIHEDDRIRTLDETKKLFKDNYRSINFINRYIKKDGSIIYLSWRASLLKEENILIATADDVTEIEIHKENLLKVKNELDNKQKVLQVILNHMPNYVFYKDSENKILFANKAAASSMGLNPDEMAGKHTREFFPEQAGQYYSDDLKVINNKKPRLGIEEKYIDASGETRWIRTDKVPIFNKEGEVKELVAIATDITQQKIDAQSIEDQNRSINHILRGAKLGYWELENQSGEMKLDEIWLSMLGYEKGEVYENIESVVQLIHPEDKQRVLEKWDEHVQGHSPHFESEFRMLHKNGSWLWILDKGLVISHDDYNLPIKSIGIHQDISFMKEAEEALQKSNEELLRSNKELDDFAHIASHDLREPLRGMHYNANFLLEDYSDLIDEKGKGRLERLIFLSQRMNKLVDDLLFFSRLGKGEIGKQEADLNEIAEDVINSLSHDPKVEIKISNKLPSLVCDKVKINTLYLNLVQNAIKYNDKEKIEIEIGSKKSPEGKDILFVKDNGIGIAEKHFDEIFKIFRRVVKKDAYGGGTGSGLCFVKKIIDLHKGDIWVESQLQEGTTFLFTLWNK